MTKARTIFGFIAIAGIALGANLFALAGSVFSPLVFVPLVLGAGAGAAWIVLLLSTRAGSREGSTVQGLNAVLSSLVFLGICITVYAFIRRSDASYDLTKEGLRTISPQTIQVLEGLENDVEVFCIFVEAGDDRVDIVQQKTRRFLERCQQFSARLSVTFIDPQREPERIAQELRVLRVSPVGTVMLRSGAQQREIPLSDVTSRLEERDFTNALINVIRASRPKVYFLTGHGERDITDEDPKKGASDFRLWQQKEAYDVEPHLIAYTHPEVPDDCSVLVIPGYTSDFRPPELQALDTYIDRGGRILLLSDPAVVQDSGPLPAQEQLRPWLARRLGIELGADVLTSPAMGNEALNIMFVPDFTVLGSWAEDSGRDSSFRGSFNMGHPITGGLYSQMVWRAVRSVSFAAERPKGLSGAAILRSTPDVWAETDINRVFMDHHASKEDSDKEGPISTAVAATLQTPDAPDGTRVQDARVVVVGDADLSGNEAIKQVPNHEFLLNAMAWLSESEDLIAIRPTGTEDPPVVLSLAERKAILWISVLGTTQFVAVAGVIMWFLRRRNA